MRSHRKPFYRRIAYAIIIYGGEKYEKKNKIPCIFIDFPHDFFFDRLLRRTDIGRNG